MNGNRVKFYLRFFANLFRKNLRGFIENESVTKFCNLEESINFSKEQILNFFRGEEWHVKVLQEVSRHSATKIVIIMKLKGISIGVFQKFLQYFI